MFWSVLGWFAGLKDDIVGFFTGAWSWLKQAGRDVISGLWLGLMEIWEKVEHWIEDRVKSAIHKLTHPWEFASPSHLMQRVGENIMEGWLIGMQKGWKDVDNFLSNLDATDSLNQNFGNNMTKALTSAVNEMNNMGEFNPTITPVLDLTQVSSEAKKIHEHINGGIRKLNPSFSIDQARAIAHQQRISHEDSSATEPSVTQGVNFEQNIYSPTQLSTSDIYKQTRNQIRIAKEELSIP